MASEILRSATNKGYSVTGRTETKILCNKDFSSAQILRIYLHIYLASEGCAPRPLLYVKHIVIQLFLFVSGSKI